MSTSPEPIKGAGVRQAAVVAWLRLARVYQKMDHHVEEQCRCHGLSGAQFDVLAHVGASKGMTQQELATSLLVTKGNVCQLLDRMERSDLLVRRQEGRANRLFLTEKGQALFGEIVPRHESFIAQRLGALSSEEQVQLLGLLRKLDRALDESACAGTTMALSHRGDEPQDTLVS